MISHHETTSHSPIEPMRRPRLCDPVLTIACVLIATTCSHHPAAAQSDRNIAALKELSSQIIALSATHQRKEALNMANRYRLAHGTSHAFYASVGQGFELGRDSVEALKIFKEGLKSYPDSFALHNLEANTWLDVGEGDNAETDIKFCAKLQPHSATIHNQMARVFIGRGDLESALSESRQAIAVDPKLHDAWAIHSAILTLLGRYKEACVAIDRSIALAGTEQWALIPLKGQRGPIREKLGQYQGAIDDYEACLKPDQYKNPKVLVKVGACYMQLKQPQKALSFFDLALKRDPDSFPAHRGKLAALEALHQPEAAAREKKFLLETQDVFTPLK
jgi:tetratricopeptide (TPR) repeat protein